MNKYDELYNELSHYWNEEALERMLNEYKELVERATPKKPKNHYKEGIYDYDECPNCGDSEIDIVEKYCPNCGQKLKWSE